MIFTLKASASFLSCLVLCLALGCGKEEPKPTVPPAVGDTAKQATGAAGDVKKPTQPPVDVSKSVEKAKEQAQPAIEKAKEAGTEANKSVEDAAKKLQLPITQPK